MIQNKYHAGFTLLELMITVVIMGVLLAILLPLLQYLMGLLRLNIATVALAQHWKITRYDATGSGESPLTLCMADTGEEVQFIQIRGDDCNSVTAWRSLPSGVNLHSLTFYKVSVHSQALKSKRGRY